MRPRRKLPGLKAEEKRWRALPSRLLQGVAARMPGTEARFRRALAEEAASAPSETLRFAIPFAVAERVLGQAAIIDIDPRAIDRWLMSEARSEEGIESPREHFLIDGPWNLLVRDLNRSGLDAEVRELISCGGDYRRTSLFEKHSHRLSKEGAFLRNGLMFRDIEDVEAYCAHHVRLIESVRRHGVVRRSELAKIGAAAGRSTPNSGFLEAVETDAGVAVGPKGTLLRYRGGFHRTAAARELGLASMPVQVKLVHLAWLRRLIDQTGLSAHEALIAGLRQLAVPARGP